jgi:hypothetical protein
MLDLILRPDVLISTVAFTSCVVLTSRFTGFLKTRFLGPYEMHWNSFRFCIGPVPDRWLDIADEAGQLIQNEYFVWTGNAWHGAENQVHFNSDQMIQEYKEWDHAGE